MTAADRAALIEVRGLEVMPREHPSRRILKGVDFEVRAGECLAVIGESGAGKSLALKAVCGLLPPCLRAAGSVRLEGREVLDLGYRRSDRGRRLLYLSQQPMSAFEPLSRLGGQLIETLRTHEPGLSQREARRRIEETLARLRFENPAEALDKYPSELSGGMLQRAMTAVAVLLRPQIVVADEPTSALDVLSVREVLRELMGIRRETGATLVVVTHDLAFARRIADRCIVFKSGEIVESGPMKDFERARHPYVRRLAAMQGVLEKGLAKALAARPDSEAGAAPGDAPQPAENSGSRAPALIEVERLAKSYPVRGARSLRALLAPRARRQVLRGASFSIAPGEAVGLVGASGEGKSTLARILLGLEKPDSGAVRLPPGAATGRLAAMSLVSQNYVDSADPSWNVARILAEPLEIARVQGRAAHAVDAAFLARRLAEAGLPAEKLQARPYELSGGELQRVCIARALIHRPRFVVFDEALSSLDASVQGEMIELLKFLRSPETAWLFISHDLKAVAALCSRVLFLKDGRIIESLAVEQLSRARTEPVRALIDAARG